MADTTATSTEHEITAYTLRGRRRIYTDSLAITAENVIQELQWAIMWHEQNAAEMRFLLRYEKGYQPLPRKKTVRSDIDINVVDNVANQVVVFKMGYIWGNPILYIHRGNRDIAGSDEEINNRQDTGVTMLNEMNEIEFVQSKDQELARYVEICGIGHQMVDVRPKFNGLSCFELMTLNPLYTFCIYRNSAKQEKLAGVTFRRNRYGDTYYTVFTPDRRYEILNIVTILDPITKQRKKVDKWEHLDRSGEKNPFEMIPIVEFDRSPDRTGCFERQISDMDALNVEVSDFANTVSQTTQEIWWGNDFDLPVDSDGKPVAPVGGQWVMTSSAAGNNPKIQPLHSSLDLSGVQANIESKRDLILEKCYVPRQSEPGGGSTGTAMSMSSGWAAAEAAAAMEERMLFRGKMEIANLEIKAIHTASDVPSESPLLTLRPSDVLPQFTRNKTYDLVSKVNAMVTMIKAGVHGRAAMETVDLFTDVAQTWADSRDVINRYQEAIINRAENTYVSAYTKREDAERSTRAGSDTSDQIVNSPIIDGFLPGQSETVMRPESRNGSDIL